MTSILTYIKTDVVSIEFISFYKMIHVHIRRQKIPHIPNTVLNTDALFKIILKSRLLIWLFFTLSGYLYTYPNKFLTYLPWYTYLFIYIRIYHIADNKFDP